MHLLGRHMKDHLPLRITLTNFYGIGLHMAERLMARLSIHHRVLTGDVSEAQYTALSAYLSSTTTHPTPAPTPICPPGMSPSDANYKPTTSVKKEDPLESLKIETDLRRATKSDIAHLVAIGTYRGRRHAAGLPVRGQRTKNNIETARRHNSRNYRPFSSSSTSQSTRSLASIPLPNGQSALFQAINETAPRFTKA